MAHAKPKLLNTTTVFLVGDIPATIRWYELLGFESQYFPPGFGIVTRDAIAIFLQQQEGYVRPEDPAADERGAWDVYIDTDNVAELQAEFARHPEVRITRKLHRQEYGQMEFEVTDLNGYVLVFAQSAEA